MSHLHRSVATVGLGRFSVRTLWNALAFALPILAVNALSAQATFPERAIQLIVPFSPGSAPDLLGRLLGEKLALSLGKPVYVVNMPGASGNVGVDFVAKSKPDGHTLVLSSDAAIVVNPSIYQTMPFDPQRDLAPISQLVSAPNLLVVGTQGPKTLAELIELARRNRGRLTFASPGAGTSPHRSGELFARAAGIDILHVPYRSAIVPDVASGQISMFFATITASLPLVRAGTLRALAVTSAQRSPAAPDIPTMAEQGLAGFEETAWFGLFAPADTPPTVIARLYAEVAEAFADPKLKRELEQQGAMPVASTPEAFAAFIAAETPKWAKLMKDVGITPR